MLCLAKMTFGLVCQRMLPESEIALFVIYFMQSKELQTLGMTSC